MATVLLEKVHDLMLCKCNKRNCKVMPNCKKQNCPVFDHELMCPVLNPYGTGFKLS